MQGRVGAQEMLLKNPHVAVVTGGASGIGLAIAHHLGHEGYDVVAVDSDEGACGTAHDHFVGAGHSVHMVLADIGTEKGATLAIESAIQRFGRIDVLCNNAAIHPLALIEEQDLKCWRETFRVNVDGTMLCCQSALPHMKRQGRGSIVNIGSISGHSPYSRGGAYAASKAAVAMLTRVLALEAGPFGITVNCIEPGSIRRSSTESEKTAATHIPVGRKGESVEVAQLVGYLASDAARYINGSLIVLDGGATAGRIRHQKRNN